MKRNSTRARKLWRESRTPPQRKRRVPVHRQSHARPARVRKRVAATTFFIRNSNATAIGAKHRITDMCGSRVKRNVRAAGIPTRTVAGFTPTPAGLGSPKNRSVGQRIIMDAGRGCAMSAGFGCPAMNGRRLGFPGARAMNTSAGRRSRRKRASIAAAAFTIGLITITTSVPTNIASCQRANSGHNRSSARWCRASATSRSLIKQPTLPILLTTTRRS